MEVNVPRLDGEFLRCYYAELERWVRTKFQPLPLDANGYPCRIGDLLRDENGHEFIVCAVGNRIVIGDDVVLITDVDDGSLYVDYEEIVRRAEDYPLIDIDIGIREASRCVHPYMDAY